jgi:RND family efflux transporter MFP subunit
MPSLTLTAKQLFQRIPAPVIAFLILFALSAVLTGCDSQAQTAVQTPARPVLVTTVHYANQTPDRTFVGTIKPRIESDLGFRVAGKVAKRLVEVGDAVKPGQPLALLDQSDLKLQADQAEAELAAATGVKAQAQASLQRSIDLRAKGWTTDAQMDTARAAADEAQGRFNRAERAVELTKNSLSYATLTADADGVVTATLVEPGQVVAAGQGAIRVARSAEKEAVVAIPETLVARARDGAASVSLWSEPDRRYEAKLRELAPMADPTTRTYLAKFSLPGAGKDVKLGMTATLTLCDQASERVAKLPLSALFNQGTGPALFVVDTRTGEITLKPVTVKSYDAQDVVITRGVNEGDSVVALGVQKLDTEQRVRVVSSLSF